MGAASRGPPAIVFSSASTRSIERDCDPRSAAGRAWVLRSPVTSSSSPGACPRAPENTTPALLAAPDGRGCDGVEFDVRASRDGVPVLCHDETLERVWGRPERVDQLRADALEAIGLPTLAEVLERLPRD